MKKAILLISFGTSHNDTRKATIDAVENKICFEFKDYEVRKAFTSNIIIKKLKTRDNIVINTPKQALEKLKDEGFEKVIVQPLHIIPGFEFHQIINECLKYKKYFKELDVGRPVLCNIKDYKIAAQALKSQMPVLKENEAVVLMGHGTEHAANSCYLCLQSVINDEGLKAYVSTVEGYPKLKNIITKLKKDGIKKVILMPYMLVAGEHAKNDMAGDDEDSWRSILIKEGFEVECYLKGLGENKSYQDIYVKHIKDVIWHPYINEDLCINCGKCYEFCPRAVYKKQDNKIIVGNPQSCVNNCHGCEWRCPAGAISFPEPFTRDYALKVIKHRKAKDKPISKEFIKYITHKNIMSLDEINTYVNDNYMEE